MKFLELNTIHEAVIQWWWEGNHFLDSEYCLKVNHAMEETVKEVERQYDVTEDTRFCCQFEGVRITGTDAEQVKAAGLALERRLARFKKVTPV